MIEHTIWTFPPAKPLLTAEIDCAEDAPRAEKDRRATLWAIREGKSLREADLINIDLTQADLSDADLSGVRLPSAKLSFANLTGVDLTGANLRGTDMIGANLTEAVLSSADLSGADLTRADLWGADLCGAKLCSADLRGADLTGAKLSDANLTYADLCGANLVGVDLSEEQKEDIFKLDAILQLKEGQNMSIPLPHQFRAARAALGFTVKGLSEELGVSRPTIHRVENGGMDYLNILVGTLDVMMEFYTSRGIVFVENGIEWRQE